MNIEYGEHAIDYDEIAKQEHLSAIEGQINRWMFLITCFIVHKFHCFLSLYFAYQLKFESSQINCGIFRLNKSIKRFVGRVATPVQFLWSFQKREISFRNLTESMNTRVLWWSIFLTIVLVSSAIWQITSLGNDSLSDFLADFLAVNLIIIHILCSNFILKFAAFYQ